MDGDQAVLFDAVSVVVLELGKAQPVGPVTMLSAKRIDKGPDRLRQPFISGHQVGEGGVAAETRHDVSPKDRARRRVHCWRDIRMPPAGQRAGLDTTFFGVDAELSRKAAIIDRINLRVAVRRGFVVRVSVGQLAETTPESDLGGVVQVLASEEDHLPGV